MSELVIVISIMGVLATITVGSFSQFLDGGKDALATERQEALNQAVHRYAQLNRELLVTAVPNNITDETLALRRLQYRNPNEKLALIGSPYYDPRYSPASSSLDSTYRLRWTGRIFELLKPGKAGTGLLMNFDGTDFGEPVVFSPDFDASGH